jgi:hypothetical protein
MASQIVISKAGKPEVLVDRPLEAAALGADEVRIYNSGLHLEADIAPMVAAIRAAFP